MHCHALTLRAGQTGRLTFSITPEGDYTLAGAVRVEGKDTALIANGADLFIPTLPPGLHLLEVRANGCTVMYGGLEVLPSPLEDASGEVAWAVHADLAETIASISITLSEGPPGPQGEKGEQGDPGPQGEKGEQGEQGPAPTDEQVQQAVESTLYQGEAATLATSEGADSSNAHYIELDAQHVPVGSLTSISIKARPTGANPATYSYLGLWEENPTGTVWEYRGSSTNAPGQSAGYASTWTFDNVILHGRKLRVVAQSHPTGTFSTGNALGLCVSPTPSGDTSRYIYNNVDYAYLPELVMSYRKVVDVTISTQTASLAMDGGSMQIGTDVSQYRYPIFFDADGKRNDYSPSNPGGSVFTLMGYVAVGYDIYSVETLQKNLAATTPYIHKPTSLSGLQIQGSAASIWLQGRLLVIDLSEVAGDLGTFVNVHQILGDEPPDGTLAMPVLFFTGGNDLSTKLAGSVNWEITKEGIPLRCGCAGTLIIHEGHGWLNFTEQLH